MSDEMNTNNGEETAALFVSSQKKKQAEEEARKKAEAEQAKRDAAEAEVRRMEAEVEERKRKAEEERRALEEAAKQAEAEKINVAEKIKASVDVEEIKSKVKETAKDKSKLPILIGAGAAAVVIIVLIIVFALKGKGSSVDVETLEFAKEYSAQVGDNTVTVIYPESLYTGFAENTEESGDDKSFISESEKSKNPVTRIYISQPQFLKADAAVKSAKAIQSWLDEYCSKLLSNYKVSEESVSDVKAEKPGKYYRDCTISTDDGQVGAVSAWYEPDNNGNYSILAAIFTEKGDDPANVKKLRDAFEEKNSDNALKIPGACPPASADTDGMLELDAIHMGIIVPKDRFTKAYENDSIAIWTDENSALYAVAYQEVGFDFETAREHKDEVQPMLKEIVEKGAATTELPNVDSRMFVSDSWLADLKYFAEYKDVFGDVTYRESNMTGLWRDIRTQKYYIYNILLLAPSNNTDVYKPLYEKAIDRLQDI